MSKTISMHSLTMLRKKIRDEGDNHLIKSRFINEEFDFDDIEFVSDYNYPELSKDFIDVFYKTFYEDQKNEFKLAKLLYENIKIDKKLAANNLYWVYINLTYFFRFIKDRWLNNVDKEELDQSEIDRYFLALDSSQNSLMISPVAGLWWAIELTIDSNLKDKYHYSKIFLSDRNLRNKNLGTYQLIRHKHVLQALLDFYIEFKDAKLDGNRIGSEAIAQQMTKTLNQIGGLTLLGYLSKKEVYEILLNNKMLIFRRANNVKKGKVVSKLKVLKNENNLWNQGDVDAKETNRNEFYFILDKTTGNYKLATKSDNTFSNNISLDINNNKCFLVHVYLEGKIKKTNLDDIRNKIQKKQYNSARLFKNGINSKLHLNHITKIVEDSIFCLAYKANNKVYVKLLNAQDETIFRSDSTSLRQEGKKVIYTDSIEKLLFKSISSDFNLKLKKLICSPTARGVLFKNPNYKKEWSILKKLWPELFVSFKNTFA